jgi:hypothetical protein
MKLTIVLAYVDPGSGALVWQMLAATAVGVLFYFRKFRKFVFGLGARLRQPRQQERGVSQKDL